jgi:hypothetical protein
MGLELQSDPTYEEREWIAQRIGWVVMCVLALASLAGVLGPGPLSEREEGHEGAALHVKYQRFGRYQAPAKIQIFCRPGGAAEQFELSLAREFVEAIEITEISPEPEEVSTKGKYYLYRFKRADGDDHLVTFRLKAEKFGAVQSEVTLDTKDSVRMRMFFWP